MEKILILFHSFKESAIWDPEEVVERNLRCFSGISFVTDMKNIMMYILSHPVVINIRGNDLWPNL